MRTYLIAALACLLLVTSVFVFAGIYQANNGAGSPWPMFRHDLAHSGVSQYVGPDNPTLKMRFKTTGEVTSSPSIGPGGQWYITTEDGFLLAFDQAGRLVWDFKADGPVSTSPTVWADGTVLFGSEDHRVYAVNPGGGLEGYYEVGGEVYSSIATDPEGVSYFGAADGTIYAIDPEGTLKWEYVTGGDVDSSPAVSSDGTVYVGSNDGKLYALDRDGNLKWAFQTGDSVVSSPAIGPNGIVYVGSDDGNLYAVNPADGSQAWKFEGGGFMASPAVAQTASGTVVYAGSYDGNVYAINAATGAMNWKFETGDEIWSSAMVDAKGAIYVGSNDGKLYAINPDGTQKWVVEANGPIISSPALSANGEIYFGDQSGYVYIVADKDFTGGIRQHELQADPTNKTIIYFEAAFDGPVDDFTADDVILGGTAEPDSVKVTGSGDTYLVAVSGMKQDGTVTAAIEGQDPDIDNEVTFDKTRPTCTINQAEEQADPTRKSPINFTVVFSEPVFGFEDEDVVIDGTADADTAVVTGNGTVYNVAISGMKQDGTVVPRMVGGFAQDAAGNYAMTSTSTDNTVTFQGTRPVCTINQASYQPDPTNKKTIYFEVEFTKAVTGFEDEDVIIDGSANADTAVVTGSGKHYTVAISGMKNDGTVVPRMVGGFAVDEFGNYAMTSRSTDNTVTYDTTRPTCTINQAAEQADPTRESPINFTVVFSEPVFGFENDDVIIDGTAGADTAEVTDLGGGKTFNVAISGMKNNGTVVPRMVGGFAQDAAGNYAMTSTSTDNTVTFMGDPPTSTINQASYQPDPTNSKNIYFTVEFSVPVTGFDGSDVIIGGSANADTAIVEGSGKLYTVIVSGMKNDGTVTATMADGFAVDATGNGALAPTSTDNEVLYDGTRPTCTINQAADQADPTRKSPINFTVVFSEPVTGFDDSDVIIDGTAEADTAVVTDQGDGMTYNVAISGMKKDGTVVPWMEGGFAQDAAGNYAMTSTSTDNTVTFQGTRPTCTINQAEGQADPTNESPIFFTVVFSKPVTGFEADDIVFGGTAGADTAVVTDNGDGMNYTVAISGMKNDGTVVPMMVGGFAIDEFGNYAMTPTATDNTVTYKISRPTCTIDQAEDQADPTNSATINFTAVFSDPVTGFDGSSVIVGGTAGATTAVVTDSGDGMTFNVAVSGMTNPGTVIVSIDEGAAQDTAGNLSEASTSTDNEVTYDATRPACMINQALGQADPTEDSVINFTVVFATDVTGFDVEGLDIGGTAGADTAVISGSGKLYTVAVSGMKNDGTVIVSVKEGAAEDAIGNLSEASTSIDNEVTYVGTPLTCTINQAEGQADPTGASPINFTVLFNKPVTDFDETGVDIGGTTGADTVVVTGSGDTYNVAVSGMTSDGIVTASVKAGAAKDTNGKLSDASTSDDNEVTYDATAPTCTINQADDQADPTASEPVYFTVEFSKPVEGFDETGVDISGSANADTWIVTGSGTTYTVAVSGMTNAGTVVANVKAGAAEDVAGNLSDASTSTDNEVTYDGFRPTCTVDQAAGQDDPTNAGPINFTVVFNKPVTGFDVGSVILDGTAGPDTVEITGSGDTYNVAVSGMTNDGTVIVSIAEGAAEDALGNISEASTSTDNEVTYDATRPTCTINQADEQDDPTNDTTINFTVEFSEDVTGFDVGSVVISGTAGADTAVVTGSGKTYNVAVSGMKNNGTVIASVGEGAAQDGAGNQSEASTSDDNEVTYDGTRPACAINQALSQPDPTNVGPINFIVEFSEDVFGFDETGIEITGGTGADTVVVAGSGRLYTVAVSGMQNDGKVIANVVEGAAQDVAGNLSEASTSTDNEVTYDTTRPTCTINQADSQADPTNDTTINFTVVFSEDVTGFDENGVEITGTAGADSWSVTGSGTTYNVAVSGMTNDGTVIANVIEGAAEDAMGYISEASTSTDNEVTYDATAPTCTIEQAEGQADPTNASPINFTVVFSEEVTGFDETGVNITGTAGATTAVVTGSGATYNVAVSGMANDGTVVASVKAGAVADAAGNASDASTSTDNEVTYKGSLPTCTINQAASQDDPTNASPINFTVVFSEEVTGFDETGVNITGTANADTVVVTGSGTTYNVAVSGMANDGTVVAEVVDGAAVDVWGNTSEASTSTDNEVTYDATAPTCTIEQAASQTDPTNAGPINFTVVFSEEVTGFDENGVEVTGTAGADSWTVTGSGNTYTVSVSGMANDGTVIASVKAGAAVDASGNASDASTSTDNEVTYDATAPTCTIEQAASQADPTNDTTINFTVVFSEEVTGFDENGVEVTGTAGADSWTVTGSGNTYTVAVSGMANDGTVIASVKAGAAVDAAGNASDASTSTDNTVTYDATAPTCTIEQAASQADPTNDTTINFTVVFSEEVTGFDENGVEVTGTAGADSWTVTGSGTTYTVAVSGMANDGTVVASVKAGAAVDAAGNASDASTSTDNEVTYDATAPICTIDVASGQTDPTSEDTIEFTFVFSKPVTGFDASCVLLTGTAQAEDIFVTGSGTAYTVSISDMQNDGTVIVNLATGAAVVDEVGNVVDVSATVVIKNEVTYQQ